MKYKLTFSYDGSLFYGYAKQPNLKTVQGAIESKLSLILNTQIIISASGRTDRGVHAFNQVASFECDKEITDLSRLTISLNKLFAGEIFIKDIKKVKEDFDARYSAKKKAYLYLINIGEYSPFKKNYFLQINADLLNISKMKKASKLFFGQHNFQNFCSKDNDEAGFIREIYSISFKKVNDILEVKFSGNGFMRYEVRKIMGVLIEIGKGNLNEDYIQDNLTKKERSIVPYTAAPQGLYLFRVYY